MGEVVLIYYCSFCGSSEHSSETILTAHKGDMRSPSICNNCIDLCNTIIAARKAEKLTESNDQEGK